MKNGSPSYAAFVAVFCAGVSVGATLPRLLDVIFN